MSKNETTQVLLYSTPIISQVVRLIRGNYIFEILGNNIKESNVVDFYLQKDRYDRCLSKGALIQFAVGTIAMIGLLLSSPTSPVVILTLGATWLGFHASSISLLLENAAFKIDLLAPIMSLAGYTIRG